MAVRSDVKEFVRPPPIKPSNIIRVFSPAGTIHIQALEPGNFYLKNEGFRVDQPATVAEQHNYFAGNFMSRAKELYDAVMKQADNEESIIWAARGGYGSAQLVEEGLSADMLDSLHENLVKTPKWLVGYSDITVISLHLWAKARVLVLHGPMVFNITSYSLEALRETWSILRGSEPYTQIFPGNLRYGKGSGVLAKGRLLGGNIQVIASLLGAKDKRGHELLPAFDGCIVLLEEVNEPAYRIHRSLCALLRSPKFKSITGIAIGQLTAADAYGAGEYNTFDVLHELLLPLRIPVITEISVGHETETARPIVLGAEAEIDGAGLLRVTIPGCDAMSH